MTPASSGPSRSTQAGAPTSGDATQRGDALPPVDPRIYDLLRRDIERRGRVVVPVITDEAGRVLDGKLRLAIAEQLGIRDVPRIKLLGLTEAQKQEARVIFNLARRQLSRAEIQGLIEWELTVNPTHSDRRIAGKIGASPTTVGKIRARVQVGQVDRLGRDNKVYTQPAVYTHTDTMQPDMLLHKWENRVVCMDCVQGMKLLPPLYADLFVFSPPYGTLRTYIGGLRQNSWVGKTAWKGEKQCIV
jgi:hypothetical protein